MKIHLLYEFNTVSLQSSLTLSGKQKEHPFLMSTGGSLPMGKESEQIMGSSIISFCMKRMFLSNCKVEFYLHVCQVYQWIIEASGCMVIVTEEGLSIIFYTVGKYKFPAGSEFDVVGNFRNTV